MAASWLSPGKWVKTSSLRSQSERLPCKLDARLNKNGRLRGSWRSRRLRKRMQRASLQDNSSVQLAPNSSGTKRKSELSRWKSRNRYGRRRSSQEQTKAQPPCTSRKPWKTEWWHRAILHLSVKFTQRGKIWKTRGQGQLILSLLCRDYTIAPKRKKSSMLSLTTRCTHRSTLSLQLSTLPGLRSIYWPKAAQLRKM